MERFRELISKPYFAVTFLFIAMVAFYVICYIARSLFGIFDVQETGATEILTYLFYGFGGGVIFCCAKDFIEDKSTKSSFLAIVFIYIIMIFREMGAQGWLTTHDTVVTKIRFFTSPLNPLYEKIIAGAIMLFIVAVFLWVFVKHSKAFWQGLLKGNAISLTTITLFIWTILTQIIDRFPAEYLKHVGTDLAEPIRFAMKIFEECGEALIPILIVIAFLQFHYLYRKNN